LTDGVASDDGANNSARLARERRFRRVARSGFAINGFIHFLVGGIAIRLAFGDATVDSADQSGALQQLASTVVGRVLLWASVVGLTSLGLWQITRSAALLQHPSFFVRWGRRIVEGAKGLLYLGLGATALIFALGGQTSPSENIRRLTVVLLETRAGVFIVLAIGLTALGAGIGFASIGIRRTFTKLIRVPSGRHGAVIMALGVTGYLAKGFALAIVGVLFIVASVTGDPSQASGLDGALRVLLDLPLGQVLLSVVGAGLVLFGIFLMARTRLARL